MRRNRVRRDPINSLLRCQRAVAARVIVQTHSAPLTSTLLRCRWRLAIDAAGNLSGVTSAERLVVTLTGVNDGTTVGTAKITLPVLVGDTTGNGLVKLQRY